MHTPGHRGVCAKPMKVLLATLIVLLLALQYRLWFGDGSVQEVWRLREEAKSTRAELIELYSRNQALAAEVADLKSGLEAIEERARAELGMIGQNETFYQFVLERGAKRNASAPQPLDTITDELSGSNGE